MMDIQTKAQPKQKPKSKRLLFLRIAVALLLCLILVFSVRLPELISTLKTIQVAPALGVVCCMLTLFLLGAFNIWLLLNTITPINFTNFLQVYTYSWAMSLIVPGQAGDASIILLLKKDNIPFSLTATAYLLDKIITLILFMTISLYGCFYLFPRIQIPISYYGTSLVLLFSTVFFMVKICFAKTKLFLNAQKILDSLLQKMTQFRHEKLIIAANIFLTIVKWLLVSYSFYLAFLSFGVKIGWPDIGIIPILSTLVGYIPISIAGVGTVEITAVYLFEIIGITNSVVLSAYLFMRFVQYILAICLISFSPKPCQTKSNRLCF